MKQRTRKLMTMHKALHPRGNIDRQYVSRKEEGRGFASIKDGVDSSIQRLQDYIQKHKRGLFTAIKNETDNMMDNRKTITRNLKLGRKTTLWLFKPLINNISHEKTWTWLKKGNFKREAESLLKAAQNDAIRTNHIKVRIDKTL